MPNHQILLLCLSLLALLAWPAGKALAAGEQDADRTVTWAGSQPSAKGPAEYFTGSVRVDPLFPAKDASPVSGAYVTFEPGARTAWHVHPAGQHLVVTAGVGRMQIQGGLVVEIRPGDVVWFPPGVRHWHGASPTTAMTHMAITGSEGGKNVDWQDKVSDEQYAGK